MRAVGLAAIQCSASSKLLEKCFDFEPSTALIFWGKLVRGLYLHINFSQQPIEESISAALHSEFKKSPGSTMVVLANEISEIMALHACAAAQELTREALIT